METVHRIIVNNSGDMNEISDESIDLVVTSPPYPMISMWDSLFSSLNPAIGEALSSDGDEAFRLMHEELDKTWEELKRVVRPGGIVCINIGDAVRTVSNTFRCYQNHVRIATEMKELGFLPLPEIIWRKPTNSPNKFMGSGMLPTNAYVTLEHEFILIFRKEGKRTFDAAKRRESAIFWEERNEWFSDTWTFIGTRQKSDATARERTAAFPSELPKRLILMFSIYGDTVLDPFAGTGTTMKTAAALGRNSVGYEIDDTFASMCKNDIANIAKECKKIDADRFESHRQFTESRLNSGKEMKHMNRCGMPVVTLQEKDFTAYAVKSVHPTVNGYRVEYSEYNPEISIRKKQSTLFRQ